MPAAAACTALTIHAPCHHRHADPSLVIATIQIDSTRQQRWSQDENHRKHQNRKLQHGKTSAPESSIPDPSQTLSLSASFTCDNIRSRSHSQHRSQNGSQPNKPIQNPPQKAKRPPGNRVASSLGRIAPTEAKPLELSGEILSLAKSGVKD